MSCLISLYLLFVTFEGILEFFFFFFFFFFQREGGICVFGLIGFLTFVFPFLVYWGGGGETKLLKEIGRGAGGERVKIPVGAESLKKKKKKKKKKKRKKERDRERNIANNKVMIVIYIWYKS